MERVTFILSACLVVILLTVLLLPEERQRPGVAEASCDSMTAPAAPAAKERAISVHAILCGASEEQWTSLLNRTSTALVQAGGAPLANAGTSRGCPSGFLTAYAYHLTTSADLVVVAVGREQGDTLTGACRGDAGGCAQMNGRAIFLGYIDQVWAPGALAHEIGHCLGLNHSRDSADIMFHTAGFGNFVSSEYLAAMAEFAGSNAIQAPRSRAIEAIISCEVQR